MPTHAGPNTFGEENLVFGYDLGDSKNSFPGIPAVNCATAPESAYNWTVTEISDGSITPPRPGARVFKFVCNNASNLHRQGGYYNGGGFGGGNPTPLILGRTSPSNFTTVGTGKYRFGMWVRGAASNGSAYWTIDIGDRNGAGISVDNNTDWQFISTTDAAGIASTSYPYDFFDINGTNGQTYYVADYGIFRSPGTVDNLPTLQAFPQWVDFQQERSYTQGLLDLVNNSTINLANVSFDSNAQMTFDGTNDYIDLGSYLPGINTSILSIELVFKSNSITTGANVLLGWMANEYPHGYICTGNFTGHWSNESIAFYNEGPGTTPLSFAYTNGSGLLNDTNYHHAVFILQTNGYKIYIDGSEVTVNPSFRNGSMSTIMPSNLFGYGSTDSVIVGAGSNPASYSNIKVPIVKIYNRILTAAEVQSNYTAIKSRFNI
jgi:hypothetical protein